MMNYIDVPIGVTIPFTFDTFSGTNGSSITLTGLAVADIKVYKGTTPTVKATTNGIALMGAGIDIGGVGVHGFAIDTNISTGDVGFWAIGSFYTVVVDSVVIDTQTVRFIVGKFRLIPAETVVGYRKVDSQYVGGTAAQTAAEVATAVELELGTGSNFTALASAANLAAVSAKTGFLPSATAGAAGGVAIVGSAMSMSLGTDAITAASVSAGAVTKIQTGLATPGAAMALTPTERTAVANAHLDLADGIEVGLTPRQLGRVAFAANGGKTTGMDTATGSFRNLADTKNRIQATLDGNNRTAITLDLT